MKVGLLILLTIVVTVGLTVWLVTGYLFPKEFTPVKLDNAEQSLLSQKLKTFGVDMNFSSTEKADKDSEVAKPEAYTEVGAKREVEFTQRELNGILANNSDLANKVAIDLSNELVSANVVMPIDRDFPILGGKTLKASTGIELAFKDERPVVILKGVKLWGVPIPNAWLGNLKNVDMVQEFGGNEGFWKSFSDGVEDIVVEDGRVFVKLKE